MLLCVVLDEAGCSRLGKLLELLLTVVMATQVTHVGRVLWQFNWVPSADQIETTDLLLLASQTKGMDESR